jgi:serine/threonine-protein kinase TNNI3K
LKPLPVLHRNLKPGAVLLTDDLEPVIGSFSFAEWIDPDGDDEPISASGTLLYMTPEVHKWEKTGLPSDVYSYGILLYEMVTGKQRFAHLKGGDVSNLKLRVIKGERPQLPEDMPTAFKELLPRLWDADPSQRPTFAQIIEESDKLRFEGCDETA